MTSNRLPLLLTAALLFIAACQPTPKPTPSPTPSPDLTHYTPFPPTVETPGTRPAPPDNRPSRTPEPYPPLATPATAAPLQEETATVTATHTPVPSPAATRETTGIDVPVPLPPDLPRLGVAAALGKGLTPCDGRQWQMAWSSAYYLVPADCPGVEHVPMLVWGHEFEWTRIEKTLLRTANLYWLVWNEPESTHQANLKPAAAVEQFHDEVVGRFLPLAPGAKLIIGGVNGGRCGLVWLEEFVALYRAQYGEIPNLAGFHFHIYPDLWAGDDCTHPWQWNWATTLNTDLILNGWLGQAQGVKAFMLRHGRPGDEVFISETSCLAPPPAACHTSMVALANMIIEWLNTEGRWITRVAWYADYDQHWWTYTHLYTIPPDDQGNGGQLSAVGQVWLNAELLPTVPLEYHRLHFPIIGYASDVVPQPRPTATPPGGYP